MTPIYVMRILLVFFVMTIIGVTIVVIKVDIWLIIAIILSIQVITSWPPCYRPSIFAMLINKKTRSKKVRLDDAVLQLLNSKVTLDDTCYQASAMSPPPDWVFINKRIRRHWIEFLAAICKARHC